MKRIIRNMMQYFGFEIRRYSVEKSDKARLAAMLHEHDIDVVLDVGANVGLYGELLRDCGYKGRIVAFEPLSDAHKKLLKRASSDVLWDVAPRGAIGDKDGELEINIASNSTSSSLLPMLGSHVDAAPHSKYLSVEKTPVRTLDSVVQKYLQQDSKLFLKIDTQGYESQVLNGAVDTINKATGVQLEISLVPLYDGQDLYFEMIDRMKSFGFVIWGISTVLINTRTGRLLQIDAIFFRD